jgi:hypothetical protein
VEYAFLRGAELVDTAKVSSLNVGAEQTAYLSPADRIISKENLTS